MYVLACYPFFLSVGIISVDFAPFAVESTSWIRSYPNLSELIEVIRAKTNIYF